MSKFCTQCGKEINENAVVCIHCGCAVARSGRSNFGSQIQAPTILGIIGIISAWLFALAGHITSIIGIVLGAKEYKETKNMTGLVLSILGEVCAICSSIIGLFAVSGSNFVILN